MSRPALADQGANWRARLADAPAYLALLTDVEAETILGAWAGECVERPTTRSLVELLETQARRTPNAPAVLFEDRAVTFSELHATANRLAHHLRTLGVGPDTLVAIALERSPDLIAAVLGVLKAGGAYVPLDPAYPKDRLAGILEDARAPVLITQSSLSVMLPVAPKVVCIDSDAASLIAYPDRAPLSTAGPNSLAYVIYTSGSTGKPKGVAVEHRSAVELIHWAADTYSSNELAGVLFGTSVCFDLSVFEMFVPLALGGTIVLADNALHLPTLPARDRVTLLNTVPSAAAELVRIHGLPASVRVVNLAGEPLPEELARAIHAIPTVEKLYNLYGPTEDTVYSTCRLVERGERIHLGRPLPNTRAYILDRHGQPVPAGVPGELHLAGAGLARGYLNRPDLTAERFIPDPFDEAGRMYKTGDLCRWRLDGTIDFLGRLDHQVKVRGFRIELGEIESELRRQPGVRQALVVAVDDPADGKRLVAYVVGPSSADELRDGLRRTLPEYMIPAAFVLLDSFPLTPNGKVDRKRLPAPEVGGHKPNGLPRDEVERHLVQIWKDVLKVPAVGTADSFFDLGGHSLLAVRLIAAVEQGFGRRLPLGSLFRSPNIEEMAALLREPDPAAEVPLLVRLRQGSGPPLFCVPGQGDYGFQFRELASRLDADRSVYTFSFERWERDPDLFHTVEELAALFVAEVRRVQPTGPYRLLGLCLGGCLAFEMAQQLWASGEVVESLILLESFGPPHIPLSGGSKLERARLLWRHFRHLGLRGKARFLRHRIAGKLRPRRGPALPMGEVMGHEPGTRPTYFKGVYRARSIPGRLHVIRAADQPAWFHRFGDDAPDLGWAGFARNGVTVSVVPGGRIDVLHEPGLGHLIAHIRTALKGAHPARPR